MIRAPRFRSATPPRHTTVAAYAALVLALTGGGAAYAASQVGPRDIQKDAVRSKHIKDGQVRTPDLAAGAVGGAQVGDDSLSGLDIAESTLGEVPSAATLSGRGPASFASSTVYKREATTDAGTPLGDGTHSKAQACDAGDILLSGGPASVNATSTLLESFPTPGSTNSWSARINTNGVADSFTVVVLCLDQT